MTIDTLTIIIGAALIGLSLFSVVFTPLIRKPRKDKTDRQNQNDFPSISIVLAVHDGEEEIERNLPKFLTQDYEGQFEVIVVDESSTDNTAEVLKRLKNNYHNLYTTFIPDSSHYISRRKLALTVGVKAAKHDWIIFTDADCSPADDKWLRAMAAKCDNDTELVIGATRYHSDATDYQRLERLMTWWREAYETQHRQVFTYSGHNMMFRREKFVKDNGFLNSLMYLRGEYDFLANEYGETMKTVVAAEPQATLIEDAPSTKTWINDHLYHIETRKHLTHGRLYKTLENADTFMLHLNLTCHIAVIALATVTGNYILCAAAALSLLVNYLIRVIIAGNAMRAANETISPMKIPFLESFMAWRNLSLKIKHSKCDKYDFIRR